jgi:hypothetical protein
MDGWIDDTGVVNMERNGEVAAVFFNMLFGCSASRYDITREEMYV